MVPRKKYGCLALGGYSTFLRAGREPPAQRGTCYFLFTSSSLKLFTGVVHCFLRSMICEHQSRQSAGTSATDWREAPTILALRRDPRVLKIPPYISAACIFIGVAWLFLLPLDKYSRQTYISENALLPGQVHTYFGESEQNVFRAFKHEVDDLATVVLESYVA